MRICTVRMGGSSIYMTNVFSFMLIMWIVLSMHGSSKHCRALAATRKLKAEDDSAEEVVAKLDPQITARYGEVVWARMKGYPWWPGRICDPRDLNGQLQRLALKKPKESYLIYFLEANNHGEIPFRAILPFEEHFDEFSKKQKIDLRWMQMFAKAVELAKKAKSKIDAAPQVAKQGEEKGEEEWTVKAKGEEEEVSPQGEEKGEGTEKTEAKEEEQDVSPLKGSRSRALYANWSRPAVAIPRPNVQRVRVAEARVFKAISWNVAGLRSFLQQRGDHLTEVIRNEDPDIIVFEETKLQESSEAKTREKLAMLASGYEVNFNSCSNPEKKGYSGTAMLTLGGCKVTSPTGPGEFYSGSSKEDEGRLMVAEYKDFVVIGVYTPNSGEGLARLKYRINEWDPAYRAFLKKQPKPVIAVGDFNAAHRDQDIWNLHIHSYVPQSAGCSPEERESFGKLLTECNMVDVLAKTAYDGSNRGLGYFTYWSQRAKNKEWNKGLRLDYTLVSQKIESKVVESFILDTFSAEFGDHAPVGITLLSNETSRPKKGEDEGKIVAQPAKGKAKGRPKGKSSGKQELTNVKALVKLAKAIQAEAKAMKVSAAAAESRSIIQKRPETSFPEENKRQSKQPKATAELFAYTVCDLTSIHALWLIGVMSISVLWLFAGSRAMSAVLDVVKRCAPVKGREPLLSVL